MAFIGILIIDIVIMIVFGSACIGILGLIIGTIVRIAGRKKGNNKTRNIGRLIQFISFFCFIPLLIFVILLGILTLFQS